MKILFDNYQSMNECKNLWGFGLYLKEYKLLFDTGSNGRVLLQNMKKANVDPKEIEYIFISHFHWDHIFGIDSLLELNSNITLILPNSFCETFAEDLKTLTKEVIIINEKPQKLLRDIYTTGVLGKETPEQSLIIKDDYPKLISGCGHYGIEKIVKIAKWAIDSDIKMAIGGFHLFEKSKKDILDIIKKLKDLKVESVLPTHCTGDKAIMLFKEHFGKNYYSGGVCREIFI